MQRDIQLEKNILAKTFEGREMKDYDEVKDFFDFLSLPGMYDFVSGCMIFYSAPKKLSRIMLPKIGDSKIKIMDFGCGNGMLGKYFIDQGHNVNGMDISEKLSRKALKKGYSKIRVSNILYDDMSGEDGYDMAISTGMIGHYITPDHAIPKMAACLKQDSVIGFSSLASIGIENLEEIVEKHGFEITDSLTSPGCHYCGLFPIDFHYIRAERK